MAALPTIPLFIFGILEPLLLIWAYITNLTNPIQFYHTQHPLSTPTSMPSQIPPQALTLTLLFGNVLLLLALLALLCSWTSDASVAKGYLLCVAVADWGHIYAVYAGLGGEVFWDVGAWNDVVWGNVGASLFLNVMRLMAVAGVFGRIGGKGERKVKGV